MGFGLGTEESDWKGWFWEMNYAAGVHDIMTNIINEYEALSLSIYSLITSFY